MQTKIRLLLDEQPDLGLLRSVCKFWRCYFTVKPSCSISMMIKINIFGVRKSWTYGIEFL